MNLQTAVSGNVLMRVKASIWTLSAHSRSDRSTIIVKASIWTLSAHSRSDRSTITNSSIRKVPGRLRKVPGGEKAREDISTRSRGESSHSWRESSRRLYGLVLVCGGGAVGGGGCVCVSVCVTTGSPPISTTSVSWIDCRNSQTT